jgi:hypothetical protein
MTDKIQRPIGTTPRPKADKAEFLTSFTSSMNTNPTTDIVTMKRHNNIILTDGFVLKSKLILLLLM